MRRLYSFLLVALLGMGFAGCDDFLEESSQDEVRPSTVTDLEQLLLGEGYIRTGYIYSYLELLTDNVEQNFTVNQQQQGLIEQGEPAFVWDREMFDKMENSYAMGVDTWAVLYAKIKGCNVVLDMLDRVDGEVELKLNQRGQALALRSYYYFILVNLFAEPYNKEGIDLDKAPGVPLILSPAVKDDFPKRASLKAVYGQIEKDLLEAADLLEKYGKMNVKYKVTPLFATNLLSRLYLYMGEWEKCVEFASRVIAVNPQLLNLADHAEEQMDWFGNVMVTYNRATGGVLNYDSPELIWGYGDKKISASFFYQAPDAITYPGSLPVYAVSSDLIDSYDAEDLRPLAFYERYFKSLFPMVTGALYGRKTDANTLSNPHKGMRVAEAYLNRAEANVRLALESGDANAREAALSDLNYLREHRYKRPYVQLDLDDAGEILELCLDERRKELAFDDHRWFDLRRCGMPELVHVMHYAADQQKEVRLPQGGDGYVLPIPKKVMDRNPGLAQNF